MNIDELEVQFLRSLQDFIQIKLERRQKETSFFRDRNDESAPMSEPVSLYAPMLRLLNGEDERFLVRHGARLAAGKIRRSHRLCFLGYVALLADSARALRRERIDSLRSSGSRNFDEILSKAISVEIALFSLQWLSWKHRARLRVSPADVSAQLEVILGAWRCTEATAL
jgi:hypothetical protein